MKGFNCATCSCIPDVEEVHEVCVTGYSDKNIRVSRNSLTSDEKRSLISTSHKKQSILSNLLNMKKNGGSIGQSSFFNSDLEHDGIVIPEIEVTENKAAKQF